MHNFVTEAFSLYSDKARCLPPTLRSCIDSNPVQVQLAKLLWFGSLPPPLSLSLSLSSSLSFPLSLSLSLSLSLLPSLSLSLPLPSFLPTPSLPLQSSYNVAFVVEVPPVALLPNFVVQNRMLKPFRYHTGGTIMAGKLAKERGWAINIGKWFNFIINTCTFAMFLAVCSLLTNIDLKQVSLYVILS